MQKSGCAWEALWGSKYCALHLEETGREAIEEWRAYIQQNKSKLEKANLTGAPLDGINLSEAQLQGANLFGAKLNKAVLESANLQTARLTSAILKEAILTQANLSESKARGATFDKADLTRANLAGAELYAAKLRGTRLNGCNLAGADLREAKMEGAILRKARLINALLIETDMQHADLTEASIEGSDLSNANLRGANLTAVKYTRYVKLPTSAQGTLLRFILTWKGGILSKLSAIVIFILIPFIMAIAPFAAFILAGASFIPSWVYIIAPLWPIIFLALFAAYLPAPRRREEMRKFAEKRLPSALLQTISNSGAEANSSAAAGERKLTASEKLLKKILFPTVWNGAVLDSLGPCNPLDMRYFKDQSYLEAWITHIADSRWKRFWMFVWGFSCGYGDNIWLWILWAIVGRLSFAATIFIAGSVLTSTAVTLSADSTATFFSNLQAFLTLDIKEVHPISVAGRVVLSMRQILGYVMLASLVSLLTKRLARLA